MQYADFATYAIACVIVCSHITGIPITVQVYSVRCWSAGPGNTQWVVSKVPILYGPFSYLNYCCGICSSSRGRRSQRSRSTSRPARVKRRSSGDSAPLALIQKPSESFLVNYIPTRNISRNCCRKPVCDKLIIIFSRLWPVDLEYLCYILLQGMTVSKT